MNRRYQRLAICLSRGLPGLSQLAGRRGRTSCPGPIRSFTELFEWRGPLLGELYSKGILLNFHPSRHRMNPAQSPSQKTCPAWLWLLRFSQNFLRIRFWRGYLWCLFNRYSCCRSWNSYRKFKWSRLWRDRLSEQYGPWNLWLRQTWELGVGTAFDESI